MLMHDLHLLVTKLCSGWLTRLQLTQSVARSHSVQLSVRYSSCTYEKYDYSGTKTTLSSYKNANKGVNEYILQPNVCFSNYIHAV